ncbi:hypothetical protein AAVH_24387 [Aphelenchoides avenae]|nr:hypothetical protein AAVH_24387 [Aphelenchus avenae]
MMRLEGQAGDPVGVGVYSALSCEIGTRDVYPRLCDYSKKWILPRWMRVEVEAVFYTHHNASDEYYSTAESYVEDVAIIQLVDDIRAQKDMRSRQYLRPACLPTASSDFDWKLAGKLNDGRPQATFPFTWGLRLSKERTGLRAGAYAKIELKSVTTQTDGNDEWQTKLCATPGLLCIVLPFKTFDFDYWMLPGTGVFATTNEQANQPKLFPKHYLYGHIVEVLPCRNNKKHYHIVIRETQSILTDLCFYTGACPDEDLLSNRNNESTLSFFLDTTYLPKFHNGSRLWKLPDWNAAAESVASLAKMVGDVGQKPGETVVKETDLLNGPDSGLILESSVHRV